MNTKDIETHTLELKENAKIMTEIRTDLATIKQVVLGYFPGFGFPYAMKSSPLRLNKSGETAFKILHGNEFLEKNKEFLFDLISKKSPQTALDVEMVAKERQHHKDQPHINGCF